MSEIKIIVEKEKFKALKGADINVLLKERLLYAEETLKAELEADLIEKIKKLEEKLEGMEKEIGELREFHDKALTDRGLMIAERDRLRAENEELRQKVDERKRELENVHGS